MASAYKIGKRRKAAEEVCWALMLMIGLGGLDEVDLEWRKMLGEPMEKWADLAVETGEMKPDASG